MLKLLNGRQASSHPGSFASLALLFLMFVKDVLALYACQAALDHANVLPKGVLKGVYAGAMFVVEILMELLVRCVNRVELICGEPNVQGCKSEDGA